MNKRYLQLVITSSLILSCATDIEKHWLPNSAFKTEGRVKLAYDISANQQALLHPQEAIKLANQQCKDWGYQQNARQIGDENKSCAKSYKGAYDDQQCISWRISREYQCQ
jgi:hypothetical protein